MLQGKSAAQTPDCCFLKPQTCQEVDVLLIIALLGKRDEVEFRETDTASCEYLHSEERVPCVLRGFFREPLALL